MSCWVSNSDEDKDAVCTRASNTLSRCPHPWTSFLCLGNSSPAADRHTELRHRHLRRRLRPRPSQCDTRRPGGRRQRCRHWSRYSYPVPLAEGLSTNRSATVTHRDGHTLPRGHHLSTGVRERPNTVW